MSMKPTRIIGWTLFVSGSLSALLLLTLSLAPQLQTISTFFIGIATFIPLLWLPSVVAIVGLTMVQRGWGLLLPAGLALVALAQFGLPFVPDNGRDVGKERVDPDLTLVSLNLEYGRADVDQLVARIGDDTDLVALQEYTPDFGKRLEAAGVLDDFAFQVGSERDDAGGTMLLSRTPVEIVAETDTRFDNFIAKVDVEGTTWHVGVIHATPPQIGARAWAKDAEKIKAMAQGFTDERLVLVGDFNAIDDHHTMRELEKSSLVNAIHSPERQGMDAWQPTWPAGSIWPAFARIDHLLSTPRADAGPPVYFEVDGTDHKGIVGTVWASER